VCDFMGDLLQIADAILCRQCSHIAGMKSHLRFASKSHIKLHSCEQPISNAFGVGNPSAGFLRSVSQVSKNYDIQHL
jgi:hypothetical protein